MADDEKAPLFSAWAEDVRHQRKRKRDALKRYRAPRRIYVRKTTRTGVETKTLAAAEGALLTEAQAEEFGVWAEVQNFPID